MARRRAKKPAAKPPRSRRRSPTAARRRRSTATEARRGRASRSRAEVEAPGGGGRATRSMPRRRPRRPPPSAEARRRTRRTSAAGRALVPFDPLQRYLTEIRRYPLLSREEEKELAIRYKEQQDVEAAYKLVTGNLRLVVMIAREYQRATRNLLDLIQEGNIGLMEAVKKFDPYRGIRFPVVRRLVGARLHHPLPDQQLAGREARHHAGAAQAVLQSAEGEGAARGRGHRARAEADRAAARRQGVRGHRDGAAPRLARPVDRPAERRRERRHAARRAARAAARRRRSRSPTPSSARRSARRSTPSARR